MSSLTKVVCLWLLCMLGACTRASESVTPTLAAPAASPAQFGPVGGFALVDQGGRQVTNRDLADRPRIYGFFFTSCTGPCPRLTGNMRRAQDRLADLDVGLVSISVDPETDTPEVLAAYAASFTADTARWPFLTGEEDEIYALMRESFSLGVDRLPDSEPVAAMRVTHATRLVAVDAKGRIRGYYDGESEEGLEATVARLRFLAGEDGRGASGSSRFPLVNASLNGLAAVLLVLGYLAIRRGKRELHALLMRAAFLSSVVFLGCYLYYHIVIIPLQGGPTEFNGGGALRGGYLILLATHVLGAMINLPMVLMTMWRAHKQRWEAHARLARKTFPLWLYVSLTGVLVYLMLYPLNPTPV